MKEALKKFFKMFKTQKWKMTPFKIFFVLFGGNQDNIVMMEVKKQNPMMDNAKIGPGCSKRGAISHSFLVRSDMVCHLQLIV